MNKKLFLTFCLTFIVLTLTTSVSAFDTTNLTAYWSFDNTAADIVGGHDLTLQDNAGYSTDKDGNANSALTLDGTNDYANTTGYLINGSTYTISMWVQSDAANSRRMITQGNSGVDRSVDIAYLNTHKIYYAFADSDDATAYEDEWTTNNAVSATGNWVHLCMVRDGTNYSIYANGTLEAATNSNLPSAATDFRDPTTELFWLGAFSGVADEFDGKMDEIYLFDRKFTSDECSEAYTCFDNCLLGVLNHYTVNVSNLYDDSGEAGVNVSFYNATGFVASNLTDASGQASISITGAQPFLYYNASKTGFYNDTGRLVVANGTNTSYIYQGVYNVSNITTLITHSNVSKPYNCTLGGKTYDNCTNIYTQAGQNLITWLKTGWYGFTYNLTAAAYDVATTNFTGAFNALLTVNATNAYTNNSITSFTINISNTTNAYAASLSTTNGTVYTGVEQGVDFLLLFYSAGYAYANTTLTPTNTTPYYTFDVYANNSILINIFDEDTGSRIYENITVVLTGNVTETTYTTTAGELFLANVSDGAYTVKLSGANYTLKSYTVTVADHSSQILNAYLSSSTSTVTFTAKNSLSGETVEGVSVGIYRIINATLTLVESKTTDITGRVQFVYTAGVKYSFVFSKTGFDTKAFSLDPVLFSTYDVYIDPVITETQSYGDVSYYYIPYTYFDNASGQNNSFVFTLNSPNGVLTNYSVNITWPNGAGHAFTGNNANGEAFALNFTIYNSTVTDVVTIKIGFQTVYDENRQYTFVHGIIGDYGDTIIENRIANTYGLGLLERVLIATFFALLFAAIASIVAGKEFGLGMGLIVLGIMAYIGFVPWLMVLLSLLIGVTVLVRMAGD